MTDGARPDPQALLFAALASAAAAADRILKDGYNKFHDYHYTKSETIIREGRRILLERGVTVIPGKARSVVKSEVPAWDKGAGQMTPKAIIFLEREFTVVHKDGGSMLGEMSWGLDASGGKTWDKASGAAETTCFAYYLRSLLMLPREDELGPHDQDHNSNQGDQGRGAPQRGSSGPRSRTNAPRPQETRQGAPAASPAAPAASGPVVLSAKAEARLKRIKELSKPEDLDNAQRWFEDVISAINEGQDVGFSDAEVAAFRDALSAKLKEIQK